MENFSRERLSFDKEGFGQRSHSLFKVNPKGTDTSEIKENYDDWANDHQSEEQQSD